MKKPKKYSFNNLTNGGYDDNDNKFFPQDQSFKKNYTESDSSGTDSSSNDYNSTQNGLKRKRKKKDASNGRDNIEDDYEREIEEEEEEEPNKKKTRRLLPIKTEGKIIHRIGFVEEDLYDPKKAAAAEKAKLLEREKTEEEKDSDEEIDDRTGERDLAQPVSTAELLAWRDKALAKCRYKIGILSSSILEDPQENVAKLALLNEMLNEYRPELVVTVKKLVSVSLLEIFKDILPAYQIKHQDDESVKLKKDTLRLQNFEKSLLKQYRLYLEKLEKLAAVLVKKKGDTRKHTDQILGLGKVALNCLCELVLTHPYFNYSTNVAHMLIPYLNNPKPDVRVRVAACITQLFKEDKRGEITLHIVRQINQLVKARTNAVHTEVVSVFLSLRLKDINLDQEKEAELKGKQFQSKRSKLISMSKKEKKAKKRLKLLEQELMETKAEENKQEKQKVLTEVTKVIFTVYFRILKKTPTSKLLCTTLEGIAKFAHLINLEFYQDLVFLLSRLMDSGQLDLHQQLLCVQTVFTILSGYGEALNIDPTIFYTHLYRNILSVHAGKTYCEMEIILKTLDTVIIKRRKRITQQRSLAYTKRLATIALQLLHNGSLGCLNLIRNVMLLNSATDILLELDSSVGQGIYLPELEDPEHCNAASTALYELTALRRHYHPTVRKMAENIMKNVPTTGDGSLPPDLSKMSSLDLFRGYNPLEMVFKPNIPAPKAINEKAKLKPHIWHDRNLEDLTKKVLSLPIPAISMDVFKEVKKYLKKSKNLDLT